MTFMFNNMNMFGMNGLCGGFGNPFMSMSGSIFGGSYGGCFTPGISGGYDNWGSIYNINGCGMPSGKEVAGWAVGTSIFSVGMMWAQSAIADRRAAKVAEEPEETIEDQIQEQLKILGVDSEAKASNVKVEEKLTDAVTKANDAINAAKEKVEDSTTGLNATNSDITSTETKINEIRDKGDSATAEETQQLGALQESLKKLQAHKKELEALKKTYEDGGELTKNLNKAKEAVAARETEIKNAKDELSKLTKQRNDENKEAVLDAADGAKLGLFKNGRTSKTKLDEKIKNADYSECTIRDMHAAISAYRSATNETDKTTYKEAFLRMYNAYVNKHGDAPNDTIRKAYELLK